MSKSVKSYTQFFVIAIIFSEILTFKIFDLQKVGHGRDDATRRQISKSTNVIFFTFLIYAKTCTTCANDCNTHTDTQTQTQT